jgi:O-succinylbenzoate synthase
MKIRAVHLNVIKMPLKSPFLTHLGAVNEREGIIVAVEDENGVCGFGEGVAFSSPWYTEETVQTSLHVLTSFLIPLLKKHPLSHPSEASQLFKAIRRNQMAKAAIETALWDLFAKLKGKSLSKLIGGTRTRIPSGVVVATDTLDNALKQIEYYSAEGYQRFKIKINPDLDLEFLRGIRRRFPKISLMADANSAYTLEDAGRLQALDEFNLLMIEQPLAHDDIIEHAQLQERIQTPICLDESIVTFEDARKAVELGSCKIINIKIGRVGGLFEAIRIHDFCYERGIDVWAGGMIEFGVSRAHNIALASLPGFTIPGDISASSRFWEEDIIIPEVTVNNGWVEVPVHSGIGYQINEKRLWETLVMEQTIHF